MLAKIIEFVKSLFSGSNWAIGKGNQAISNTKSENNSGTIAVGSTLTQNYNYAIQPLASATDQGDLSHEADQMLMEASHDYNCDIGKTKDTGGTRIFTNKKLLNIEGDPRSEAVWSAALEELVQRQLVTPRGHQGQIFTISGKGFQYVDRKIQPIIKKALIDFDDEMGNIAQVASKRTYKSEDHRAAAEDKSVKALISGIEPLLGIKEFKSEAESVLAELERVREMPKREKDVTILQPALIALENRLKAKLQ